jgi:hypothetical protein
MDVPVTIAFPTAKPANREHGWILVQVDSELALDDAPEGFAHQLGEQPREPRTVPHARQREAAGGTDRRCVRQDGRFVRPLHRVVDQDVLIGRLLKWRRVDGCLVQQGQHDVIPAVDDHGE